MTESFIPQTTHVSFDIWKTLVSSNPDFKPARNALVAEMAEIDDVDVLSLAVRQADTDLDAKSDITGIQYGPDERLETVFKQMKIIVPQDRVAEISRAAQELFLEYPLQFNEPGLLESLDELNDRYEGLCLTSNTGFIDGEYMRQALDAIGIYNRIKSAFFSNEQGCAKPNPLMFQNVINWASEPAESIVHVGDNIAADYYGAKRVGMNAVLLTTAYDHNVVSAPTIHGAIQSGLL